MKIKNGKIILSLKEFRETINITAMGLSCGHYLVPAEKTARHLEKIHCPACRKYAYLLGLETCKIY